MAKFYFSCGQTHSHDLGGGEVWDKDSLICVEAEIEDDALAFAFNRFGIRWSSCYSEKALGDTGAWKKGVVKTYEIPKYT